MSKQVGTTIQHPSGNTRSMLYNLIQVHMNSNGCVCLVCSMWVHHCLPWPPWPPLSRGHVKRLHHNKPIQSSTNSSCRQQSIYLSPQRKASIHMMFSEKAAELSSSFSWVGIKFTDPTSFSSSDGAWSCTWKQLTQRLVLSSTGKLNWQRHASPTWWCCQYGDGPTAALAGSGSSSSRGRAWSWKSCVQPTAIHKSNTNTSQQSF